MRPTSSPHNSQIREQPLRPRRRTTSLLSVSSTQSSKITLDLPKASPTAVVTQRPGRHDAFGSFVPTNSATNSLRGFVNSPTIKGPDQNTRRSRRDFMWSIDLSHSQPTSPQDSPPSSGPPSPTIPYITRTASSYSTGGLSDTSSLSTVWDNSPPYRRQGVRNQLNPILANLERKSKLCVVRVYCATCNKPGTDYPRCGKCGEMWCSRECRLYGGKRHVCRRTL